MTSGAAQPAPQHRRDTGVHATAWIATALTETWGPWLLIAGVAVAILGMGHAALRDRNHEASWWLAGAEMFATAVGIAAVVGIVALT